MPPTQQQLDPQAVALAKAIRDTESKGDWNAKGASGEWGAYQFTPATWQAYSQEFGVNAPFGAATPDQQNEVAYKKIKQWKDQGYNPGQIASMWNAGVGRPNAYVEGHKGVNKFGVEYDTPSYAEKVAQAYQRLKGQTGMQDVPMQPIEKDFLGDVGDTLARAGTRVASAVGRAATGEIHPISGLIQGVGGVAGGVGDLTSDVLHHVPVVKDVVKGVEGAIGQGVEAVLATDEGQQALQAYQRFAQEHPEMAGNIESGIDIATALPILKGVRVGMDAAGAGVNRVLRGSKDEVLEAVSPHMTPKEMASAVATRGTQKKGLLGEVSIRPAAADLRTAAAVRANVPTFNPNKPLLHNIDAVQTTVSQMAKQLKQRVNEMGAGRIYSHQEFAKALRGVEKPLLISSDVTMNNAYNRLIAKAVEIAKKKGGKVPDLLDVRQEFDGFIKKQFPNLYSSEALTPMRQAVRDIRNAITDFTVKNLPDDVGLRDSLLVQHQLLNAIENMAEKATKGAGKEIGTTMIDRSPTLRGTRGLIKFGSRAAAQGAGMGGIMKVLD